MAKGFIERECDWYEKMVVKYCCCSTIIKYELIYIWCNRNYSKWKDYGASKRCIWTAWFQVYWEGSTGTAYIVDDDISIEITKGESIFYVNGSTVYPDVPQQVIGGSLYIPLRAIADSIGADISWNAEDKMAHISYEGNDVYVNCKPQEVSLQSQVPSYYIYPAGEYSAKGLQI